MDSKERVAHILNHEEADRVPIDFWASVEIYNKLQEKLNASQLDLMEKLHVDYRWPRAL